MSSKLFSCQGGEIVLPDPNLVLVSRKDGGNLIVNPSRKVWERSELSSGELTLWSFLVAATGRAMLDTLPQLEGGCINYWEAGNWALNDQVEPKGLKIAKQYRQVHLHLLGRSTSAIDPSWRWGEAPKFPDFVERHAWAAQNERLSPEESKNIVTRAEEILRANYGLGAQQIESWFPCGECEYPTPATQKQGETVCGDCLVSATRR